MNAAVGLVGRWIASGPAHYQGAARFASGNTRGAAAEPERRTGRMAPCLETHSESCLR